MNVSTVLSATILDLNFMAQLLPPLNISQSKARLIEYVGLPPDAYLQMMVSYIAFILASKLFTTGYLPVDLERDRCSLQMAHS